MSKYRTITAPKCPYCGKSQVMKPFNYNYGKLVSMATGTGSSDVILTCEYCNKKYRVTCNIRYYGRKELNEINN